MHRRLLFPLFLRCFDVVDGAGGGAPGGGAPPASATPPATPAPGAASAPPASGAPGASAGPNGSPTRYSYDEDRSDWIPRHRYNEVGERARQFQGQTELMQSRIRALMGVNEPEDPRKAQIREAILSVMPELGNLGTLQQGASAGQSAEDAHWRRHGAGMVRQAVGLFSEAIGRPAKEMGTEARDRLQMQLQWFIQQDRTGDRNMRYEDGDPALIEEFVEDLKRFYIAPARQAASVSSAQQVDRNRRLPSAGVSGGVPPTQPGEKPKGKAVHEAARQSLLAAMGRQAGQ